MYTDLKLFCELLPRDVTSDNQSKAMGQFTDVQVILDCTELFVQILVASYYIQVSDWYQSTDGCDICQ